jgi:homoserine dehydrogenase
MDGMKTKVGFLGLGNIGSGVWQLLEQRRDQLIARDQVDFEVKRVLVRSLEKPRTVAIDRSLLTRDPKDIIEDDEIELIAEFMGGLEPARTYLIDALRRGKTVVTANKVVVSKAWEELNEAALAGGGGLYYEASAAGGIPVIGALNRSLQANAIEEIMGIVNGTTNAILTNMAEKGWSYQQALLDAQAKGYAEPDPSLDVGGQDAAYKLAILASLAFGRRVKVEDIFCEGITHITREDIQYGQSLGLTLKLMAIGRMEKGALQVRSLSAHSTP